ncbi:response regulator [Paenibacillus sp. strain BS8-2]
MPRVLVVDDEAPFCRALSKMIEHVDPQYSVIGVAFDGEQALEMAAELHPDVLITDIRMPVMDGLQLISALKSSNPDVVSVIVSSYDDFNYTRKAIQLGADDYLLKPLTVQDLQELLTRVKYRILEQTEKRKQHALNVLIESGEKESAVELFTYARYSFIVACAGSFSKTYVDSMHPGRVFWQSHDCELELRRALPEGAGGWMLEGNRENERVFVIGSQQAESDGINAVYHDISQLLLGLAEGFGIPLTLVAETDVSDIGMLQQSLPNLNRRLVKSVVYGSSSITAVHAPMIQQDQFVAGGEKLEAYIDPRQQEEFYQGLQELCLTWKSAEAKQVHIDTYLRRIVFLCKDKLKSLTEEELIHTHLELDALLSHSTTYEELYEGVSYIFKGLFEASGSSARSIGHQEDMVQLIELYLQEQYVLPITLQDLSKRFGLVPNYLSALFKKLRGVTPGEYLTQWRVEQAKIMMDESPNLLLKDVSERVGYSDPLYFSRVFKKVAGIPPSDYMK